MNDSKNSYLKNKILIIILSIAIVLMLIVIIFVLIAKNTDVLLKDDINTPSDNIQDDNDNEQEENENNNELSLNQANVNGTIISFPAKKEDFIETGWEWDIEYATNELKSGYTTSGGRIGKFPGGVVVSVINKSGETKLIEDCIIDDGTFYNPKDSSENVFFIGGLNFNSSEEEVKNTMSSLGYNNVKERVIDSSSFYNYYLDDNQDNYKNYIEFFFYDGVINYIGIYTNG